MPGKQPSTIRRQRKVWSRRAEDWDHGSVPGLEKVLDAVIAESGPAEGCVVVDLGCGTGQLSIPLAPGASRVLGVDVSPRMIELLKVNATSQGLDNVEGLVCPIEELDLPAASVDLVVSNYALHHLRDRDKAPVIANAARWLRPGGKLVIGDMMFGRGGDARDREIIASKVGVLVRRGPAGWWRMAKGAVRYLLRVQERPVGMAAWESMLRSAGLVDVRSQPIVSEAALVSGRSPAGRAPGISELGVVPSGDGG